MNRGNKLFEGSRMIIPEHRRAIRHQDWERSNIVDPPELDEQEIENQNFIIMEAIENQSLVEIVSNINRRTSIVTGKISKVDVYAGKIHMAKEHERFTIPLNGMIRVSIVS